MNSPSSSKKVIILEINADDRKGLLSTISSFIYDNLKARLSNATITTQPDRHMTAKFEIVLRGRHITRFLDNLDIFFDEQSALFKYIVSTRDHDRQVLLRQREKTVDHKTLLFDTVNALSKLLIDHIRKDSNIVYRIPAHVFEELVAEIFAANRFKVELTKRSRDGGKDIIALKYDLGIPSRWIIECKRYNDRKKIDVRLVRQLFGVKQAEGFSHAVLVTTSSFTEPALDFERSVYGLSLRDYKSLMEWFIMDPEIWTG